MIKHRIKDLLRYWGMQDEKHVNEAAEQLCRMIEDEILTAVKTAVQVRINGVPQ